MGRVGGRTIADEPMIGAVICPADGRWAAAAGGDVVRSGGYEPTDGRLSLPRPPGAPTTPDGDLAESLISVGQPYDLAKRQQVFDIIRQLIPAVRGVRMTGGAASELLGLAGGDPDAFVGFDLAPWDTTAGLAIVRACGGSIRRTQTGDGLPVVVASRSAALTDHVAEWLVDACSAHQ